jgi:hypothetical protein
MSHLKTYRNCGEHHSTYEILDLKDFLRVYYASCVFIDNGESQYFKYDRLDYFKNPEIFILTIDSAGKGASEAMAKKFYINNFHISELLCKNKYRRVW